MQSKEVPTHPQIPIARFVRKNLEFPANFTGSANIYQSYPYKNTPSGQRNASVPAGDITGHEWSLTPGQWAEVILCYTKNIVLFMLYGYEYKIPAPRLGRLRFAKAKGAYVRKSIVDSKKFRHEIIWSERRFMFQSFWKVRYPKWKIQNLVNQIKENDTSLIHKYGKRGELSSIR